MWWNSSGQRPKERRLTVSPHTTNLKTSRACLWNYVGATEVGFWDRSLAMQHYWVPIHSVSINDSGTLDHEKLSRCSHIEKVEPACTS